jgi:superfamily II DNA or RNA helicase
MTPRDYQVPAVSKIAESLLRYGIMVDGSDPGVGKTYAAAFAAKQLGWPVFVVCPLSVVPTWRSVLTQIGVRIIDVQNIERLMARKQYVRKADATWEWALPERCLIIFDEAHRMCGSSSASGWIMGAAPKPLLLLSATIADSPLRMRWLNHQLNICKHNAWYGWCLKNGCVQGRFKQLQFVGGEEVMTRIHQQVFAERGIRVRIADLGAAFPENTVDTMLVPVADGNAVDAEYYAALQELEEEAPTAAVAMMRARQMAEFQKVPAITEMVEDYVEQGRSVVVFVNFRDTLERLRDTFSQASLIYGGQPDSDRQIAIESFQANQTRICIAMVQAGGVAVSLHDLDGGFPRVSLICPGWSAVELVQALGRIHRNGGKSPCLQKLVFADGTIEQRVQQKVSRKIRNLSALNDGDLNMEDSVCESQNIG